MDKLSLGIDPGQASCGIALNVNGKLVFSHNYVPREYESMNIFIEQYLSQDLAVAGKLQPINDVFIERFVVYEGKHSSASEDILILIGGLQYFFQRNPMCKVYMLRAIEWKQRLCKYLVRTKGFSNPYPSFDKKFSLLAAKTISGEDSINTNHEADAICLSFMKEVQDYEKSIGKSNPSAR